MKTLAYFKNISTTLLMLGGLLLTSCSSFQNTSYYDNDGIYSGSKSYKTENLPERSSVNHRTPSSKSPSQPQEIVKSGSYFSQFQDYDVYEPETTEIATSSEAYYADGNNYTESYSGWGGNSSNVTINVYGGSHYGYGWNPYYHSYWPYWRWNSWYGPSWSISWGWNWGWGWSSWYNPWWSGYYPHYYPYPYYPYYSYNNVAFVRGYRGDSNPYYGYRGGATSRSNTSRSSMANYGRSYETSRGQSGNTSRSNSRFTTNTSRSNSIGNSRTSGTSINTGRVTQGTTRSSSGMRETTPRTDTRSSRSQSSDYNNRNFNSGNRSSQPSFDRNGGGGGSRSMSTGGGGGGRSSSGGRR